ncbi:MAG: septal ring lytic transglycosylase RlpA family protein [Bryobacteraceae bacterium]
MSRFLALLLALAILPVSAQDDDKPSPVPQRGRRTTKLIPIPDYQVGNSEGGVAVYFSRSMNGRKSASGEPLDGDSLTAAHPLYPFGSIVRVTNNATGEAVEVRIVDRISASANKVISVSHAAAEQLSIIKNGSAEVTVKLVALAAR